LNRSILFENSEFYTAPALDIWSDYDDTMAPNVQDYCGPQLKFVDWVLKKIGPRSPDVYAILELHKHIDLKLKETMNYQMERFPTSFKLTYAEICTKLHIETSPEDLQIAYDIGMEAFDKERYKQNGLFSGVAETLDFLLSKNDHVRIVTMGDPRVQIPKFEATGISRWFGNKYHMYEESYHGERIHIVPKKNSTIFENLAKQIGTSSLSNVWFFGNSKTSDVDPALAAGMKVGYIPLRTWEETTHPTDISESDRVLILDKFSDIKDNYHRLR
jgi:FMN phosphatase YigB (HAD superfamily)